MSIHSHTRRGLLLLLLGLLPWNAAPVFALGLNGFWEHRAAGGDDLTTRQTFQQRYSIDGGVGLGHTLQPTHAISAGANISYSRSDNDTGTGGITTRESLTPTANVGIANDIFRTSLLGSNTKTWLSATDSVTDSQSWDAVLASNWQESYWPALSFNFGGSNDIAFREGLDTFASDNTNSRNGFTMDWELPVATLYYSFNHNQSENLTPQDDGLYSKSESATDSQFFRVETGGSFWQKRLKVDLSQQVQKDDSDFSSQAGALSLNPQDKLYYREINPVLGSTAPIDGDLLATAGPNTDPFIIENFFAPYNSNDPSPSLFEPGERAILVFDLGINPIGPLDRVDIYLLDAATAPVPSQEEIDKVQWVLYTYDSATGFWNPAAGPIATSYNSITRRIVLDIGQKLDDIGQVEAQKIMVVATNPADGPPLKMLEPETFTFFTTPTSFSSSNTAYLTNASMHVRLTPKLTASSSVTLEQSESESGDSTADASRRSLSSSLRWTPAPYVTPSLRYSENLQEASGTPDALDRSYSLVIATFPLPTLNISVGATRNDRFTDARRTSTSDNYSFTSTAQLYPDLSAAFSTTYNTSSQEQANAASSTDTLSNRLTVTARLSPKLIADFTGSYRQSQSQTQTAQTTTSGSNTTMSLSYRPSDFISMRLSNMKNWSKTDEPAIWSYNLNMALLRTQKTQVSLRYNRTQGITTRNSFGLDGSWDLSQRFSLRTLMNYAISEDKANWNITTSLSLRL